MKTRLLILMAVATMAATPLSAQPKLCFPPHEGLPGHGGIAPSIDGYIDRAVGYGTTELPETGWVRSTKVTYGPGGSVPVAEFQGLKDRTDSYLYLGFTLNSDPTFDDNDVIVLVLRPTVTSAHNADERRIDIYPLLGGVGGGSKTGSGVPLTPADAADFSPNIRANRFPRNVECYSWVMPTLTVPGHYTPLLSPPTNVTIKVRSWANAADTDRNWSVEIKLPTTTALGGTNWIDLSPSFSFYYNVIRLCTGAGCTGTTLESGFTTQFIWPEPSGMSGYISDATDGEHLNLFQYEIKPEWLGQGRIGTGVGDCQGVHFQAGSDSIGTQNPSDHAGLLLDTIDSSTSVANKFIARVVNDGTVDATKVRAEFRIANWGLGGGPGVWTTIPPQAPGKTSEFTIPHTGTMVELDKDWQLTSAQRAQYQPGGGLDPHQCVWTLLSSVNAVEFPESSVRRNMHFTNLSKREESAEISGRGYADKPASGPYQFLLTVNERFLTKFPQSFQHEGGRFNQPSASVQYPRGAAAEAFSPPSELDAALLTPRDRILLSTKAGGGQYPITDWIWQVNGYRRTPFVLTMKGKKYPIYDAVGAFGREGFHVGDAEAFTSKISGGGLKQTAGTAYSIQVPVGGAVRINTVVDVKDSKEKERHVDPVVPETAPPKTKIPWWLRLWYWLTGKK